MVVYYIIFNCFINFSFSFYDDSYSRNENDDFKDFCYFCDIKDDIKIKDLTLIGTRDSAAYEDNAYQTQAVNITKQLNSGIRWLDIRLKRIGDEFSVSNEDNYYGMMFEDVLSQVFVFLDNNDEFVFISLKESSGKSEENCSLLDKYFNKHKHHTNWTYEDEISKYRKSILLFNRGGFEDCINGNSCEIQNFSNFNSKLDLYTKWLKIKKFHNIKSNSSCYINILSGNSFHVENNFIVSGRVYPHDTFSERLYTGISSSECIYHDFPRVNCISGVCDILFEGTNALFKNYIIRYGSCKKNGLYIILTDFPGYGLIEAIHSLNPIAKKNTFRTIYNYISFK